MRPASGGSRPDPVVQPPALALWLASRRMPRGEREYQLGDLEEEFAERARASGPAAAKRWLWRQAWRCLVRRPGAFRRAIAPPLDGPRPVLGGVMPGLMRDLRYALRLLRRAPLLSATAILTFALGLGANVAIFSVAWPVLGARLAFPDEARLAFLLLAFDRNGQRATNMVSPGDYFDLLEARSFERLAAFNMFAAERNLVVRESAEQLRVGSVTERFFDVLGLPPLAGRPLDARDFEPGVHSIVLVEGVWRRLFGADPAVVGRPIRVDGESWTVVGVMPAATTVGTIDVDAWTPQVMDRATARQRQSYYLAMIGRLRPGVTFDAANAELEALMRRAAEAYPESNRLPGSGQPLLAHAGPFRDRLTGPVRPTFLLLIGGAALVLLVAGTNLAGVQIARNLSRRQELAVRRAIGAGRGSLVRQLTVESLVVAALGGAAGLLAARFTLGLVARFAPRIAWHEVTPHLTPPVIVFTVLVTLAAGLAVGLGPALAAARASGRARLASRGGTAGRGLARVRAGIVAAQVAMAVVLLISATLCTLSLVRVLDVDPGFEIDNGLIVDVRPTGERSAAIRFFEDLVERAEALPGVERACATSDVPLDTGGGGMTFVAEGATDAEREGALPVGASAGCFDTLKIPILEGRGFEASEPEPVAIVNATMAKALWPDDGSAVGRRVHIGLASGPLVRVVGVVGDIRAASLESTFARQVWIPASNGWPMPERLILRTAVPPASVAGPLRELVAGMDPDLALANIRTMHDIVGEATASRRFVLTLLGGFAAIALVLVAVGIYGLLVYQVSQRTRELGIRVALGARRTDVVRAIVVPMAGAVAAGLALGVGGARLAASLLATQMYGLTATDGRVYAATCAFVFGVAALAAALPTRRATRVDPVVALRAD